MVNQTQPKWTVTSQTESMESDSAGNITRGVRVYFTTDSGQVGSVFVPSNIYQNIDAVRDLIAQQVSAVHAVASLAG